jgi:ribonuclease P protein component
VGGIALRSCRDGSTAPPRVAFAVGRRAGSAVARNRVRRRLRAAIDGCPLHLAPGGAYLFEADQSVLTMPFAELSTAVATLLRRAGTTS